MSPNTWSFSIYERAEGFRQSTYVHGADHNDFNCCGFQDFDGPAETEIGRMEAQQVAKAVYLALLERYVDRNVPAALAPRTASTIDIETEMPGREIPGTCFDGIRKHRADLVKGLDVSHGIRTRRTADGCLVDHNHAVQQLIARDRSVGFRATPRAVFETGQGSVQGVVDRGAFA